MLPPRLFTTLLALVFPAVACPGAALPPESRQIIVGLTKTWDSPSAHILRLDRTERGWQPCGDAIPVLLGKHGLAWGRGVASETEPGRQKHEGDGRAPAGLFAIGKIFGEPADPPPGVSYPYHRVTARDAWVDDPRHPLYNQHVSLAEGQKPPPWFEKHRMRLGDPVFRWRLEIRHNASPIVPGAGSAIFFHIRRSPDRKTAGCTVMAEADLVILLQWLRTEDHPHYVLLPRAEYAQRAEAWCLPPLSALTALTPGKD